MPKKTIVIFTLISLLVIVGIFIVLCLVNDQVINDRPVTIGYRTHNAYAPLFIGLENGYFKKENLEIEPIEFESTNQLMEALISGKIDAALGGVNTFLLLNLESKSPNEFKIFSLTKETEEAPTSHLIVRQSDNINNIGELAGKKIGLYLGSTAKLIFKKTLENYLDLNQVAEVAMKPELELPALIAGQIDAAIVLEPLASIGLSQGLTKNFVSALMSKYFIKDIDFGASVLSAEFMEKEPALTKKIIKATNQAIDFINRRPEETKKIIAKYTADTEAALANMKLPLFVKSTEMDQKKMQQLSDFLYQEREIDQPVDVDELFYHD